MEMSDYELKKEFDRLSKLNNTENNVTMFGYCNGYILKHENGKVFRKHISEIDFIEIEVGNELKKHGTLIKTNINRS